MCLSVHLEWRQGCSAKCHACMFFSTCVTALYGKKVRKKERKKKDRKIERKKKHMVTKNPSLAD